MQETEKFFGSMNLAATIVVYLAFTFGMAVWLGKWGLLISGLILVLGILAKLK